MNVASFVEYGLATEYTGVSIAYLLIVGHTAFDYIMQHLLLSVRSCFRRMCHIVQACVCADSMCVEHKVPLL